MLYYLSDVLRDSFSVLGVFRYLTFRGICATLTALVLCLGFGPLLIRKLQHHQIGQFIRSDGPDTHLQKQGTPTMGGALILIGIVSATLLWADLANRFVWVVVLTCIGFGLIGGYDDFLKLVRKNSDGMSARRKFLAQSAVGLIAAVFLYSTAVTAEETNLIVPFFKDVSIDLGIGFIVLTYLVVVGTSNAVNLTDGLDGLAIMPTVLVAGALAIFCYASGNVIYSRYLGIPYIAGAGELLIFCASMVGAGLGFLWFNTYPAQVFMGDIGALALGASLGIVAVVVRQEIVLFVMGGVFVAETVSVILQVGFYKYSGGKRIFLMAPLHHHFEKKGWPEPRVSVRFWIISLILVLVGLATLKLR